MDEALEYLHCISMVEVIIEVVKCSSSSSQLRRKGHRGLVADSYCVQRY